ncbi:MAG: endonuclease/exonuclease/phosphatase family protein [Clostridia bacterium]
MRKKSRIQKLLAVALSLLLFGIVRTQSTAETVSWSVTHPSEAPHAELTVITYNIRGSRDDHGIANPLAIADELKKLNGDIIALQEVDNGLPRSQFMNQAKMIADRLEMNYAYAPSVQYMVGNYGHAILSKYPIRSAQTIALPSGQEQRTLLNAVIDVNGQPLRMFETHLGLAQTERKSQMASIQQLIDASLERKELFLLAGDFNASANDPLFKQLDAELQAPFVREAQQLGSLRTCDKPELIDQIFLSPGLSFKSGFSSDFDRSDHYPIGAQISLPLSNT